MSFFSARCLLFLLLAGPALAQPDGPPNPLDVVRGVRDGGDPALALKLLDDLDGRPLPEAVKLELPLERARCQLEAAADADEAARPGLVGAAKAGFDAFLAANPAHPRAAEAHLALARLAALDAKAQLSKARRMDIPGEGGPARDDALSRQRAEAAKARPLFAEAAKRYQEASQRIDAQAAAAPTPAARRAVTQARYDAAVEAGVNLLARAETYLTPDADEKKERADLIDQARDAFTALALNNSEVPARVRGVARAWVAECHYEKDEAKRGDEEANRVLTDPSPEADDGKRAARFFKLRRKFAEAAGTRSAREFEEVERQARGWLRDYGRDRRAKAEGVAARWYLGYALQAQGDALTPAAKAAAAAPSAAARAKYAEAERLYRGVAQGENEYAARAARQRAGVVRRLLGDASKPPAEYKTFEDAQMASYIHLARLAELEKEPGADAEAADRRLKVVALLERARELAGPADDPADVADAQLRLVVFYQLTGQPDRAAVLGEALARAARPGGKPAVAGAVAVNAYAAVRAAGTDEQRLTAARAADRDRAVRLARFLDDKYPADPATDAVRHRLASILYEDGKPADALQVLRRVRPGYDRLTAVRLFAGAVAYQLLAAKDSPVPEADRRAVLRQAVADLDAVPKPPPAAPAAAAKEYLTARCRVASLYLLRPRVDPEAEANDPGFVKARKLAGEVLGLVKTYPSLLRTGSPEPTPDGWEVVLLAEDARAKAVLFDGQTLFGKGKYDDAFAAIGGLLAEMKQGGPFADKVRAAAGGPPKKEPPPKTDDPAAEDDDPEAAARGRLLKTAEAVDRVRREVAVLGLKVRVRQGQAELAAELFALLRQYGGGADGNAAVLRQLTAELGGQVQALRRDGKGAEADALAAGFGKLLDAVGAEPNLGPGTRLLLGQSFLLVGEYGKAEGMLRQVPAPADPGHLTKPAADLDDAQRRAVGEYKRAQLDLARALRLGKKLADAEAALKAAMGPADKPGWAATAVEFRREVAHLYEARGAEAADPAQAKALWSEALREWTAQANAARKRLEAKPKDANGNPDNAAVLRYKNAYYEAFLDVNRCVVRANQQLLKDSPRLPQTYADVGKKLADVERAGGADLTPEVRARYAEVLRDIPELRPGYEAAGGKLFVAGP